MKYIAKKTWMQSFVFWLVYMVIMAIVGSVGVGGLLVGAVAFVALAFYWYKIDWMLGLKTFAIAFVIDIIIVIILVVIFAAAFLAYFPAWADMASMLI